jgi:hypothetical protein
MNHTLLTRIVIFTVFFLLVSFQLLASGVFGLVRDTQGNPVPGASVYISESRTGTSTNGDGYYQVPLPAGTYHFQFQALGFARQEFKVTVIDNHDEELNVELQEVFFQIGEVRVYSGGEDPALAMMRKAIALAPYYLRQASSYEAEVYLRGSFVLEKVPRILGKGLSVNVGGEEAKVGETFTVESLNHLEFIAPDTFNHTVVNSRSSFAGLDENSPIGYINSSFYAGNNEMYISPLSPQAMRHYNFRYDGYIMDGNRVINRIRVIPRRKSQQLLEGDLYLVEDLWNIHSVDFKLDPFYGTIAMRQVYAPVKDGIWLPVSHHFNIDAGMMGIRGKADYVSSVKYLDVILNTDLTPPSMIAGHLSNEDVLPETEELQKPPQTKNQRQIEQLMEKEEMNNRDMMRLASLIEKESQSQAGRREEVLEIKNSYQFKVKRDSIPRDSLFWRAVRPIPLTQDEKRSFAVRDSLLAIANDSVASDSAKHVSQFSQIRRKVFHGTTFPNESSFRVRYGGLIDLSTLGFNTVDGWKYGQNAGFEWRQDSLHSLSMEASAGYAFARKKFYGEVLLQQNYWPLNRGLLKASAGMGTFEYKGYMGLHPLLNMGASLLFKENFWRLYKNDFVKLYNEVDVMNGLRLTTDISWHNFAPIANGTDYSFFNSDKRYHSNEVVNGEVTDRHFTARKALVWSADFEFTPRHYYRIEKGRKHMLHSAFPTFTLRLEHGLKAFGSDADYLLLETGVNKKAGFSFMPTFSWAVSAGSFLRNNQIHFSQFKHFQGSASPLLFSDMITGLFLLDDYQGSTNNWFLRAGATYSSPWLLLKNLPFFSNRMWNENLHFNYLHTLENPHYIETGYSISRIFIAGSVGVFAGFSEGRYQHWGVKIALAPW